MREYEKIFSSLYEVIKHASIKHKNQLAVVDNENDIELTYFQLFERVKKIAGALQTLGIKNGEHVSIFSENCARWLICDFAIYAVGGISSVRGVAAPANELNYILESSNSKVLIVQDAKILEKIKDNLSGNENLKFIVILNGKDVNREDYECSVYTFEELMAIGAKSNFLEADYNPDDVATLIYTSGTEGKPKGVMLTHSNIFSQLKNLFPLLDVKGLDLSKSRALSILPIWHAYERTVEYFLLLRGATIYYTNLRKLKDDIKKVKPNVMIVVPRIMEVMYSEAKRAIEEKPLIIKNFIKFCFAMSKENYKCSALLQNNYHKKHDMTFGKTISCFVKSLFYGTMDFLANLLVFKQIRKNVMPEMQLTISGASALAPEVEDFFHAIRFPLIVGYGLTETAPVLCGRLLNRNNCLNTVGLPLPETQVKVVDVNDNNKELDYFEKGLLFAKGPQVMKGYFENETATKAVLTEDGWFNTGDLAYINYKGNVVIAGREKEIIVLSNGENIAPVAIEAECLASVYIKQIVLVGQDKKYLTALVVPDDDLLQHPLDEQKNIVLQDIRRILTNNGSFSDFQMIKNIEIVNEEFSIDNGLMTSTLKLKRNEIFKRHEEAINRMYC